MYTYVGRALWRLMINTMFLHTNFRAIGGIESASSTLAIKLSSKGVKTVFVSRDSEPNQIEIPAEVSEYRLLPKRTASWSDSRRIAGYAQIWKLPIVVIVKIKDIVLSASKLRHIYLTEGEPKVVIQHQQVMTIALLAGIPKQKKVFALHRNYNSYKSSKLLFWFVKLCIRTSETTITLSEMDRNLWHQNNIVTEFIPNIESDVVVNLPPKEKIVLWVGRMVAIKNICDVITSFEIATRNFPDWKLILIGDGPERLIAEEHAKNLGVLARINFVGYANPVKHYLQATFLLLASTAEGYSLVLDEAMSFGVVPVVRPFGENTYERVPKKYGVIANGHSTNDLADSLYQLISSPDKVRMYQSKLKERANNSDKVCEAWLRVLI
jgi:glycosyltransferase involved in cell wall biosynthesis